MSGKKIILIVIILIFLVYITLNHLVFISSSTTCAKFTTQGQTKGANYLLYEFEINGVKYDGNESSSKIIDLSSDSLKKIECVKVEYSNLTPFFNRVIDKRIIK